MKKQTKKTKPKKDSKLMKQEEKREMIAKLSDDLIQEVHENDPSKSKYCAKFMIEQLQKGHKKEDLFPTVKMYWAIKERFPEEQRELYFWKDLKDLENACKDLGQSNRSQRKVVKESGATEIFRNDLAVVVRLDTKEGAVFWGKNTRWCISMENADYFNQYVNENKQRLYVIAYTDGTKEAALITHVAESVYGPYRKFTIYNAKDEVLYEGKDQPSNEKKELYFYCEEDYTSMFGTLPMPEPSDEDKEDPSYEEDLIKEQEDLKANEGRSFAEEAKTEDGRRRLRLRRQIKLKEKMALEESSKAEENA